MNLWIRGLLTVFLLAAGHVQGDDGVDQLSGNLVITGQSASQDSVKNDVSASGDLVWLHAVGTGLWTVHEEGSTTPSGNSVSALIPEANGDAGTALDSDNQGRIQLSELYYSIREDDNPERIFHLGLLDMSSFFEQSRIASDETTQFLGASFVGNPTIEFPDYSLGLVFESRPEAWGMLRFGIASSRGLADNPKRSYSQLLSAVDGKQGVFAIGSWSWESPAWLVRAGLWANTQDHAALDGSDPEEKNFGQYLLLGFKQGSHGLNIRFGHANERVSQAVRFVSASYQYRWGAWVTGLAAAESRVADGDLLSGLADTRHYEWYLRHRFWKNVFLTLDAQHLDNSRFGIGSSGISGHVNILGLRWTWLYES